MALYKSSQVIYVEDTSSVNPEDHLSDHDIPEDDIVIYDEKPQPSEVLEVHMPEESKENTFCFSLPNIPGAPEDAQKIEVKSEEPALEVGDTSSSSKTEDTNSAKDLPIDSWDWKKAPDFFAWFVQKSKNPPKHSGKDIYGLERIISYFKKLLGIASEAMRNDLDGKLDYNVMEQIRTEVENAMDRCQERLSKLEDEKSARKKKSQKDNGIVKEGQRSPGVGGIIITVPLLISRIARVCINGTVSGGHKIDDLFARQVEKYKLSEREQAEVMQLLSDMNFPINRDRGLFIDEKYDSRSSDNMDFNGNFPG